MSKSQWMKENIKKGELYAGLILGKDGQPDHHLVLLRAVPSSSLTWGKAKEWAATTGGELPTRREQSLLFANLNHRFVSAWYWADTQHSAFPDFAWLQDFSSAYQDYGLKSNEYQARAVRRIPINEEAT